MHSKTFLKSPLNILDLSQHFAPYDCFIVCIPSSFSILPSFISWLRSHLNSFWSTIEPTYSLHPHSTLWLIKQRFHLEFYLPHEVFSVMTIYYNAFWYYESLMSMSIHTINPLLCCISNTKSTHILIPFLLRSLWFLCLARALYMWKETRRDMIVWWTHLGQYDSKMGPWSLLFGTHAFG